MKFITGILFLFIPISVFSQNVNVSDYQVPISKAQTLRFNGTWNWAQTGDSVTSNNANGNLTYRTFYSSLPLAWFINVDATGSNGVRNNANSSRKQKTPLLGMAPGWYLAGFSLSRRGEKRFKE